MKNKTKLKKKHLIAAIRLLNPSQSKRSLKGANKLQLVEVLRYTAISFAIFGTAYSPQERAVADEGYEDDEDADFGFPLPRTLVTH